MARYVVANRRAGKFTADSKKFAREAVETALMRASSLSIVHDHAPQDITRRRLAVFEAEPEDVADFAAKAGPDVMVEPEILHFHEASYRPSEFAASGLASGLAAGSGSTLKMVVRGGGRLLANATVHLYLRAFGMTDRLTTRTNKRGQASFSYQSWWSAAAALVAPEHSYWTSIVHGPSNGLQVDCPPIPVAKTGWWHGLHGATSASAGRGVRVGVIDTGVGPHAALSHVKDVGAFIDNSHGPNGSDSGQHGTHVCGTIGARSTVSFRGIAPKTELYSARVFSAHRPGANQADIANALYHLSAECEVDLINMSLGASVASEIEHDEIVDALERGTLCVCAAGNSNGPVEYPAGFDETVAVSALGKLGEAPIGSLAASRVPTDGTRFGASNLYLANFSCFGPNITVGGAGVGIIAPVPANGNDESPYAAMDGTSMASPAVCGTLAGLLAKDKAYKSLPRNLSRALAARAILNTAAVDIGMAAPFVGTGVPTT